MNQEQMVRKHTTKAGTVLWKVGTSQRNILLNDAEFIELTQKMNENTEVLKNGSNAERQ